MQLLLHLLLTLNRHTNTVMPLLFLVDRLLVPQGQLFHLLILNLLQLRNSLFELLHLLVETLLKVFLKLSHLPLVNLLQIS